MQSTFEFFYVIYLPKICKHTLAKGFDLEIKVNRKIHTKGAVIINRLRSIINDNKNLASLQVTHIMKTSKF